MNFDDIETAFLFVSLQPPFTNSAILDKGTGEICYISGYGDSDELPEDVDEDEKYVAIPHKNDLDLGKNLALDFVARHLPEALDEVENIFWRKGAYGRYKELFDAKGMLDEWHRHEEEKTRTALREWCAENGINLSD